MKFVEGSSEDEGMDKDEDDGNTILFKNMTSQMDEIRQMQIEKNFF
jgi:hypothetical protein